MFCYNGLGAVDAPQLLDINDPNVFEFDDDGVTWRDYRVNTAEIEAVRRRLGVSFGSCSFTEPVDELKASNLL